MDNLIDALKKAVFTSTFQSQRLGNRDANGFAELFEALKWNCLEVSSMVSTKVRTNDKAMSELVEHLNPVLAPFLRPNSNRIGNGLFFLVGGMSSMALPTVPEFARLLVRAGALLGCGHVAELVSGWVSGDPLWYKHNLLLDGIQIDQPIELENGVRLLKLPRSFDRFPVWFPRNLDSLPTGRQKEFLGAAVLSVDCYMFPAMFQPEEGETLTFDTGKKFTHTNASKIVPGFSVDGFCKALSERRQCQVSSNFAWDDLCELQAFAESWSSGFSWTKPPTTRKTLFTKSDIKGAMESLFPKSGKIDTKRSIDMAMSRWIRAKRTTSILDTLIELRIAFEALYEIGNNSEKSFRVASYAAWYVGESPAERQECFKVVAALYGDASNVLHASGPKKIQGQPDLLARALDICRKGILKRSEEKEPVNWQELTMGI